MVVSERYIRIFVVLLVLIVSMQLAHSLSVEVIDASENYTVDESNVSEILVSGEFEGERVEIRAVTAENESLLIYEGVGQKKLSQGFGSFQLNETKSLQYETNTFNEECDETCSLQGESIKKIMVKVDEATLNNVEIDFKKEATDIEEFITIPPQQNVKAGENKTWTTTLKPNQKINLPGHILRAKATIDGEDINLEDILLNNENTLKQVLESNKEFETNRQAFVNAKRTNANIPEHVQNMQIGLGREQQTLQNTFENNLSLEFTTEAPLLYTQPGNRANTKKIIITSETSYQNITTSYDLDEVAKPNQIKLYHLVDGERVEVEDIAFTLNNDFTVESIEWVVPHLSNQEYELEITDEELTQFYVVGDQEFTVNDIIINQPLSTTLTNDQASLFIEDVNDIEQTQILSANNTIQESFILENQSNFTHSTFWEFNPERVDLTAYYEVLLDNELLCSTQPTTVENNEAHTTTCQVNQSKLVFEGQTLTFNIYVDEAQRTGPPQDRSATLKWNNQEAPTGFTLQTQQEQLQPMSQPDCTNWWSGQTQPYEISTVEDLQCMSEELNADYVLVNDIDASETSTWNSGGGFVPVGSNPTPFTGSLDGDGFIIQDLFVDNLALVRGGLFGETDGAIIENFGLKNVNITVDAYSAGVIGIMNNGLLQNVFATGEVEASEAGRSDAGGLISTQNEGTVNNTYAIVNVTSSGADAAGLVANAELGGSGFILDSYAAGFISAGGTENGLVASFTASDPGQFQSLYWDTSTSGTSTDAVGTGKTTSEMKDLSTFNTDWDISDLSTYNGETWFIDDGVDYPRLYYELELDYDNAFVLEISTVAGGETIQLPLVNSGTYDFLVDWGDGTITGVDSHNSSGASHQYSSLGTYEVSISGDLDLWSFGEVGDSSDNVVDVLQWGDIGWTSWNGMFEGAGNLVNITASDAPDLSGVSDMSEAFRESGLVDANLSHWNTSTVVDMNSMFFSSSVSDVSGLSGWDVSSVTDMNSMFYVSSVSDVSVLSGWDVSSVTDMSGMFSSSSVSDVSVLSGWDVSSVTDMRGMFAYSSVSDVSGLSGWDVSSVTDMSWMFAFSSVSDVSGLSGWDVSSVTDMGFMFRGTSADGDLGNWNVSSVTDFNDFLTGAGFSSSNYDSLLLGWSQLGLQSGVSFDGGSSMYGSIGGVARQKIIDEFGWTFSDGGLDETRISPVGVVDNWGWNVSSGKVQVGSAQSWEWKEVSEINGSVRIGTPDGWQWVDFS